MFENRPSSDFVQTLSAIVFLVRVMLGLRMRISRRENSFAERVSSLLLRKALRVTGSRRRSAKQT